MPSSAIIRIEVEAALAHKFPSALTPPARIVRPVISSGIGALDDLVQGGLPVGAMTELVGESCSGRMSVALSFLLQVTAAEKVCAWIIGVEGPIQKEGPIIHVMARSLYELSVESPAGRLKVESHDFH